MSTHATRVLLFAVDFGARLREHGPDRTPGQNLNQPLSGNAHGHRITESYPRNVIMKSRNNADCVPMLVPFGIATSAGATVPGPRKDQRSWSHDITCRAKAKRSRYTRHRTAKPARRGNGNRAKRSIERLEKKTCADAGNRWLSADKTPRTRSTTRPHDHSKGEFLKCLNLP